jgi:calcineurin-like phosphoesterase
MAWYLDGRVSAVFGTHTHVPTADPRIFPQGTAYISDVGMVGPQNSVIGTDVQAVLEGFLTQMPKRFSVPQGPVQFNSVLVDLDADGRATDIQRIDRVLP